jgi:hypothetical protein
MAKKASKKPVVYCIGEGGTSYIDLAVELPAVTILVNQPGLLISELVSTTNLSHMDGLNAYSLASLAGILEVDSYCGFSGTSRISVAVQYQRTPQLSIGVGQTAMYQNELTIRTKSGETLDDAIRSHLTKGGRRNLLFGLVPVFKEAGYHHMQPQAPHVHVEEHVSA